MSAVELPLTVGMLASWRMPEMKPFLLSCLEGRDRPARDFGLSDGADGQILQYARDALVYRGLHGLRYFPDPEALEVLRDYESCANESMRAAARKSLAYIYRRRGEQP